MNGTTTTRRRTETGRQVNPIRILNVSFTQSMDSRTPDASQRLTILARKPPVTFMPTAYVNNNAFHFASLRGVERSIVMSMSVCLSTAASDLEN